MSVEAPSLKTVFMFPGQGSQSVGMNGDIQALGSDVLVAYYRTASEIIGDYLKEKIDLARLCLEGPADRLNDTRLAQPAIFVDSAVRLHVLREEGHTPHSVVGHSLGEYAALLASGAVTFADGVGLVVERGNQMARAGEVNPGGMAALGTSRSETEEIVRQIQTQLGDNSLTIANDNAPDQVVVSGKIDAIDLLVNIARSKKIKGLRLQVSIAAHNPLMKMAADGMKSSIEACPIHTPSVTVYSPSIGGELTTVYDIREMLIDQLTQGVEWVQTVGKMRTDGCSTFIEVGPGRVLTGLVKRIDKSGTQEDKIIGGLIYPTVIYQSHLP